jgi:large subunit ribosomal protein LP0
MPKETKREKKERRWADLQDACCKYNKVLFIDADNVTSKQISLIRKTIRPMDSKMIMGKNTLMRKALLHLATKPEEGDDDYEERIGDWKERPHLNIIRDQLALNIGMIFTNGDLNEIKDVLDSNAREAPAKVGSVAPDNVIVPPGPTGLDPKQTGFFQALNVATKIVKGNIEIVNPVTLIEEGQKINSSQAALLDKLKIRPFEYKMNIMKFLDNGKLFDAKVLAMTPDAVRAKFAARAQNAVALSLGSGYITSLAAPHLVMNAFKNLASVSLAVDYDLPQLAAIKAAAAAAPTGGAAAAGGAAKAEDKPEEKEEEEEMDMGGMFGDDDDY